MSLLNKPSHPGEVLNELYLMPLDMSAITLAKKLLVPRTRIERILKGETSLTADTAMRLAKYFSTTPEYWMNLQRAWDLARVSETTDVSEIKPLKAA
jgi:antitoxin HigA-1